MTAETPPVLMAGEIAGDYELLSLLSCRNGSEVWLCSSRRDGSLHVLKRLPPDHHRLRACRKLAALLPPLNCPCLNLPEETLDGKAIGFCVLSPYYRRGTLKGYLKKYGRLRLGESVHLLKCLLTALAALHAARIIHRDVKPGNIYLTDDGRALLGDFGIAGVPGIKDTTGHFAGSAAYTSPEQAVNSAAAGPESDIFSLGSLMYEAVTGTPRYAGRDFAAILRQVLTDAAEPEPAALTPYVPDSLAMLLLSMMRRNRRERADNAAALLRELDELHLPETPLTAADR